MLHLELILTALALQLRITVNCWNPQVYEEVDAHDTTHSPFKYTYNPQMDLKSWKYIQQQIFDTKNLKRRLKPVAKREAQLQPINFGLDHVRNLQLLQESFGSLPHHQQLQQSPKEEEIQALASLLGKEPNVQLEGLKRLLVTRDHTPINEDTADVANTQEKPNIKVEYAAPDYYLRQQNSALAQLANELNGGGDGGGEGYQVRPIFVTLGPETTTPSYVQAQEEEEKQQKVRYHQQRQEHQARSHDRRHHHQHHQEDHDHEQPQQYASKYAFGYRVMDYNSGNDFGHEETSDGKTAKGRYHVLLPDGRHQNVEYWADETGFHARVTYDKTAQH